MATSTPSSPPPTSSYSSHGLRQPAFSNHRKVDFELARLKQLGKVTKKSDEDDDSTMPTTHYSQQPIDHDTQRRSQYSLATSLPQTSSPHEVDRLQQQVDSLKAELNKQHGQQELQQHTHQQQLDALETEIDDYRTQLVVQEKQMQEAMTDYTEKIATSQLSLYQLTSLVEKQDRLIQLLMEQRQQQQPSGGDTTDWHSLHVAKQQLETAIGTLKANMETNQAHMQMMMMVSTEIQTDFERQKKVMEEKMGAMADELAAKDILLSQYQQQPSSTATRPPPIKPSYRPVVNIAVKSPPPLLVDDTSRHPSLISSSSSSASSTSSVSSPPPFYGTATPPPSIPLPPIPTTTTSTTSSSSHKQSPPHGSLDHVLRQRAGSLDQAKPFWKSMKTKWRHS